MMQQALLPTQLTSACRQVILVRTRRILTPMVTVCLTDGKSRTADGLAQASLAAIIGPSIQTELMMQIGMQTEMVCQICVNTNGRW
jgi:hypothetical protein